MDSESKVVAERTEIDFSSSEENRFWLGIAADALKPRCLPLNFLYTHTVCLYTSTNNNGGTGAHVT